MKKFSQFIQEANNTLSEFVDKDKNLAVFNAKRVRLPSGGRLVPNGHGDYHDSKTGEFIAKSKVTSGGTVALKFSNQNQRLGKRDPDQDRSKLSPLVPPSHQVAEEFEKKMKEAKRGDLKDALAKTTAVTASITSTMDFIVGKEDKRQGLTRSSDPTTVSFIFTARRYIGSPITPINDTDQRVYKQAEDRVAETLDQVNIFFDGSWKEYRTMMEGVNLSPFKDYEPIKK